MSKNNIPILVSWSGGKDCAFALFKTMKDYNGTIELFTTLNANNHRVAMHGISEQLLDKQAESIGLPLHKLYIPDPCSGEEYGRIMEGFLSKMKARGIEACVFGDLYLEDIRNFREQNLAISGFKALFPLWETPTANVALEFLKNNFKAVLSCVDTKVLDNKFSGREYNMNLLGELPVNVDPCGENGEFHTFVYDGPVFRQPVQWKKGEKVIFYDRYCYTNLISE